MIPLLAGLHREGFLSCKVSQWTLRHFISVVDPLGLGLHF